MSERGTLCQWRPRSPRQQEQKRRERDSERQPEREGKPPIRDHAALLPFASPPHPVQTQQNNLGPESIAMLGRAPLALSCRTFAANTVRLRLHALAYNLGNFLRTLATPEPIKDWALTSLKDKLIKIGAKVVSHGRYVAFQMAEVAIPRQVFQEILRLIAELRPQPPPAPA